MWLNDVVFDVITTWRHKLEYNYINRCERYSMVKINDFSKQIRPPICLA